MITEQDRNILEQQLIEEDTKFREENKEYLADLRQEINDKRAKEFGYTDLALDDLRNEVIIRIEELSQKGMVVSVNHEILDLVYTAIKLREHSKKLLSLCYNLNYKCLKEHYPNGNFIFMKEDYEKAPHPLTGELINVRKEN